MAVRNRATDGSKVVTGQVRDYLAALAPGSRPALRTLMALVRSTAPAAVPAFSYRIPAFAVDGRILVWCAAWKDHVGLYPVTKAMEQAGGQALAPYRHGKGTLRFPRGSPLPVQLITRVIGARVKEMRGRPKQLR